MSEYMIRQPHEGTPLFDDETFLDDAERSLLPVAPGLETPLKVSEGASVNLVMRAMAAEKIMQHHNHASKLAGATKVRGVADNKFDAFYDAKKKNPDAWFEGMQEKDVMQADHAREALDVLAAPDALAKAGFDTEVIYAARRAVQRETADYEPGASNGPARAKKLANMQAPDKKL